MSDAMYGTVVLTNPFLQYSTILSCLNQAQNRYQAFFPFPLLCNVNLEGPRRQVASVSGTKLCIPRAEHVQCFIDPLSHSMRSTHQEARFNSVWTSIGRWGFDWLSLWGGGSYCSSTLPSHLQLISNAFSLTLHISSECPAPSCNDLFVSLSRNDLLVG